MRNNEMTNVATVLEVMEPSPTALRGYRICISGHMGRPRDRIAEMIADAGGEFHKSLTQRTTHLVTNGDWSAGTIKGKVSSKVRKAREYGARVLSEQQLYDLMMSDPEGSDG